MKVLSLDGVSEFLAELKNLFTTKSELSAHTSSHAPSNAQANQNAFSNVLVGSTTVAADSTTDTLTLVAGSNVTLTPDATNDKITIAATNTDTNVTNTLSTTTKYYVTGTTSASTNTGKQYFDTGIYATTTAGQLRVTSLNIGDGAVMSYDSTSDAIVISFL